MTKHPKLKWIPDKIYNAMMYILVGLIVFRILYELFKFIV